MPRLLPRLRATLRLAPVRAVLCGAALCVAGLAAPSAWAQPPVHTLVPVPTEATWGGGDALRLDSSFAIAVEGAVDARVPAAAERLRERLARHTGLLVAGPSIPRTGPPALRVVVGAARPTIPQPVEDESYTLDVSATGAVLRAPTPYGALRGMETFLQLAEAVPGGARVPAVSVRDAPRFGWRGLLLDVARHWLPMPHVLRTLDAMAAAKMNVLHLHLSEDQGFRVESKRFPRLHTMGSDGNYFTQDEIREIVAYAAFRGIRVVPEFDVPGHTSAWLAGHPEIGSRDREPGGPEAIVRTWGVYPGILDPTNEATYVLLEGLFGEMAALFPDPVFHIGGDEVPPQTWRNSARIQAWMRANGVADEHALQARMNRRLSEILGRHGKTMMGWDEILHLDLPTTTIAHAWRGRRFLAQALASGAPAVLSNGYYIDLYQSAARHYMNDPQAGLDTLSAADRGRVLGGEATMWAEMVTPEILDHRVWPRAAAIAERLWSPVSVRDTVDLMRRLDAHATRLERADGLRIDAAQRAMRARIAGGGPHEGLEVLAGLVEPVEGYARHGQYQRANGMRRYTQHTALTRLVDAIPSDARASQRFAAAVDAYFAAPTDGRAALAADLRLDVLGWRRAARDVAALAPTSPYAADLTALAARLAAVAEIADAALTGAPPADAAARLTAAAAPLAEVEFVVVSAVRRLVAGR